MSRIRLRHSSDQRPGFTRKQVGSKFVYFDLHDRVIKASGVVARCSGLGIPPAYTQVWICPDAKGHLQATAKDSRGRKQYFYHQAWQEHQAKTKFDHLLDFAGVLGAVRRQVARDLKLRGLPKAKIVAAIIRLLDTTYMRVGSEEYARDNHSYGLTTLLGKHLLGRGKSLHFSFRGKSGVFHEVDLKDERIRKIIAACQDLPGQDLFEYLDADRETHTVRSEDVNEYLQAVAEIEITAKDFRTWHGTVLAMRHLASAPLHIEFSKRRREVVRVLKLVAEQLGNTPAICKRAYIHPLVLERYLAGELALPKLPARLGRKFPGLHVDELRLVALLS